MDLTNLTEEELADLALSSASFDFESSDFEHYLIMTPEGRLSIRSTLAADIRAPADSGEIQRSGSLKQVLLRFMQVYSARAA